MITTIKYIRLVNQLGMNEFFTLNKSQLLAYPEEFKFTGKWKIKTWEDGRQEVLAEVEILTCFEEEVNEAFGPFGLFTLVKYKMTEPKGKIFWVADHEIEYHTSQEFTEEIFQCSSREVYRK